MLSRRGGGNGNGLFLLRGRKETNDPPQLRVLLLHLAGEAVQDVYESLHLTFVAGENVYFKILSELDKQFTVQTNEPRRTPRIPT